MTIYNIPDQTLSVGELTNYLKYILQRDAKLGNIGVTGEVSSLSSSQTRYGKALFFTLKDNQASIRCVIWSNQLSQILEQPQQGKEVMVFGSINLYTQQSQYQLNVRQVFPTGEGLAALRLQQLRQRLTAEGLFAPSRKRLLPPHPQIVAVVTSPSAAAWGDIQRTWQQRYPGLHILLSPATVQGKEAPHSIVTAIERVNLDGRAQVLILARGGGAEDDLSCFNDEKVVRAIASSPIPVITGIGHERDESLADLVADFNAHTPTAAAQKAVPNYVQLVSDHQQRITRLTLALTTRLTREEDKLTQLQNRLTDVPLTCRSLSEAKAYSQSLRSKLMALNPQAVLNRGYAVVQQTDNSIVFSSTDLVPEQEVIIQLAQGKVKVKIIEIIS